MGAQYAAGRACAPEALHTSSINIILPAKIAGDNINTLTQTMKNQLFSAALALFAAVVHAAPCDTTTDEGGHTAIVDMLRAAGAKR